MPDGSPVSISGSSTPTPSPTVTKPCWCRAGRYGPRHDCISPTPKPALEAFATSSPPATSPVEPAAPQAHPGLSRTAAPDTLQRDVTGVATSWTNDASPAQHRAAPPGSRSNPSSRINQQPRPTPQTLLDGAL